MAPIKRDQLFQLRVSDDEKRMLETLADREGLTASDKVRQMIRREYATTFGQEPPKRRKR
jgi:hypothetical protein